jgi:hypothetical protein
VVGDPFIFLRRQNAGDWRQEIEYCGDPESGAIGLEDLKGFFFEVFEAFAVRFRAGQANRRVTSARPRAIIRCTEALSA